MQIQTHPSFSACYHYLQVLKGSDQKQPRKKWRHHFAHYKSMGVFFRCSRADNSVVGGPIWPKFELVQDNIHVTYKFKMDRINSNRGKGVKSIFLNAQGQLTP